jgi:hypothetical protein
MVPLYENLFYTIFNGVSSHHTHLLVEGNTQTATSFEFLCIFGYFSLSKQWPHAITLILIFKCVQGLEFMFRLQYFVNILYTAFTQSITWIFKLIKFVTLNEWKAFLTVMNLTYIVNKIHIDHQFVFTAMVGKHPMIWHLQKWNFQCCWWLAQNETPTQISQSFTLLFLQKFTLQTPRSSDISKH